VYPRSFEHLADLARKFGVPIPKDDSEEPVSEKQKRAYFAIYRQFALKVWKDSLSRAEVDQISHAQDDSDFPEILSMRRVRLQVLENFVGAGEKEFELFTGFGSGDCGVEFEKGEAYLVVAYRDEQLGRWATNICSGTSITSSAKQEIRALGVWKAGKPLKPRIYGTLIDFTALRHDKEELPHLAGVRLRLFGSGRTQETVTDHAGEFLFDGLEARKYRVEILLPGFTLTSFSDGNREIDLSNSGYAKLLLWVEKAHAKPNR